MKFIRVQLIFADENLSTHPGDFWSDIKTTGLEAEGGVGFKNGKKPLKLLTRILKASQNKNGTILDFFAGSGSTLHAVLELNASDNGLRKVILATNNENNICQNITYKRTQNVIKGYQTEKSNIPGLNKNNLRYYKSEFVTREPSVKSKKELTVLATELLCIKEDIYIENKTIGDYNLNAKYVRCFGKNDLYLLIIYDEEVIEDVVKVISNVLNKANEGTKLHFKVYVFSNGQYPYTEEFEEVLSDVTLCALPDAIYKAYQNVLPKRQRRLIPELEEPTAAEVEAVIEDEKIGDLLNE